MDRVVLVHDDGYQRLDFGYGHPMRGERFNQALSVLAQQGFFEQGEIELQDARPATFEELTSFHTEAYVRRVQAMDATGQGRITADTPAFPGIYQVAALSVGGSLEAMENVVSRGKRISGNLCGGWHHAFAETGRGFCIFNDIAVVATQLLRRGFRRVMTLDIDAHHGDGTQRAFYNSRQVLTCSFHQDPSTLYPYQTGFVEEMGVGEGWGYNFNLPLLPHAGDADFTYAFQEIVPRLFAAYRPEVVILQMGVDGHCREQISMLGYSFRAYDYASKLLLQLLQESDSRLIFLGGGGFAHPFFGQAWAVQIANFAGVDHGIDIDADAHGCPDSRRTEPSSSARTVVNALLPRIAELA